MVLSKLWKQRSQYIKCSNVARRTCGYIGTNFWNKGRTQEIKERVLHIDNKIDDGDRKNTQNNAETNAKNKIDTPKKEKITIDVAE